MKRIEYLLTRAPLPMLALAASYGVWSFNLLFVPAWVAFVSAAAFEITYVALAFTPTSDPMRARRVAIAAVVVSVLYNVLASLFVRQPGLLVDTPLWGDVVLAVLHGAPLAVVAYHVAGLLLHRGAPDTPTRYTTPTQAQQVTVNVLSGESRTARVKRLATERGVSESTMWRHVKREPQLLEGVE